MGSSGAGGMDKHFTTFMKARIYCQLKLPTGREFAGAIDYQYNEISKSCDIMWHHVSQWRSQDVEVACATVPCNMHSARGTLARGIGGMPPRNISTF